MIKTTTLNQRLCYYPLGNTQPVSFTADLPPEQDADILLLGCGDFRNVLSTCFTDTARKLDITCCDFEPLIHARNVLLYSLLIDDTSNLNVESLWNIYYNWRIDKKSLDLFETQTEKLIQLSESLDQWHESVYGSVIRFCDVRSLSCVRSHWIGFLSRDLSDSEKVKRLKAAVKRVNWRGKRQPGEVLLCGIRAASPVGYHAVKDLCNVTFEWQDDGIMPSSRASESECTHLNPAFLYSPDPKTMMHHDLDPVSGIPLSTAFTPFIKGTAFHLECKGPFTEYVGDCAKVHFREWASAFRKAIANNLVIRVFCGDAIAFCFTLRNCQLTGRMSMNLPCDSWSTSPLELHHSDYGNGKNNAPLSFDVIDTSNLIDLLGSLNVIPITSTLLKYHASSTLYTELLNQKDTDLVSRLNNLFGADVRLVSLLLGLVSPDLFTNATDSFEDGLEAEARSKMEQEADFMIRSRLRWRRLQRCQESHNVPYIHMEAKSLAKILVQIYHHMFKHEDLQVVLDMYRNPLTRAGEKMKYNFADYNRASFASFLSFIKANIVTDWHKTFEFLYDNISFVHSDHEEDLFLNMHLYGVDSSRFQKPTPADLNNVEIPSILHTSTDALPEQVCVTMRVKRKHLKIFTRKTGRQMGSPTLACSFVIKNRGNKETHTFSTLQIAFGSWCDGSSDSYSYINEDSLQLSGSSDMFVSVIVPTALLLKLKRSKSWMRCEVIRTAATEMDFHNELDDDNSFAREEINGRNVFVTQYMPGMSAFPAFTIPTVGQDEMPSDAVSISLKTKGRKLNKLILRLNLEPLKLPIHCPVEIKFLSPLTALVIIAGLEPIQLKFPIPVSPSSYKVTEDSTFIEIETCPLNPLKEEAALFLFPASITKTASGEISPILWTSSRVKLDVMPPVDLKNKYAVSWMIGHISLIFSNRELRIRKSNMTHPLVSEAQVDTRTDLKDGIFSIFMHYTGLKCQQAEFFALTKTDGTIETLIFPSCLRLDLFNHTVVLDSAIIPVTKAVLSDPQAARFINELANHNLWHVRMTEGENRAWKAIVPALVERCRTTGTWKHTSTCEYLQENETPRLKEGVSPICSCGVGKFPTEDYLQSQIKRFPNLKYLLSRYATRAAVAPIFAVPYVEDCFLHELADKLDTARSLEEALAIFKQFGVNRVVCNKEKCILKEKCIVCGRSKESLEAVGQHFLQRKKCKVVRYCSEECEKMDLKTHEPFCSGISNQGKHFCHSSN